jgi:hypothetical protein
MNILTRLVLLGCSALRAEAEEAKVFLNNG